MRSPLRWAILFIVLFVVSSIAAVLLVLWSLSGASVRGRGEVLAIKISGEVPELASRAPFTQLLNPGQVDLRDILDGIERASGDSRIKGQYLELNDPALGWAENEEVRAAIARSAPRASGLGPTWRPRVSSPAATPPTCSRRRATKCSSRRPTTSG